MGKRIFSLSVFVFLVLPVLVFAHQPRIVEDNFTLIKNPEVSQAFYGELKGVTVFYKIQTENPIKLYVGVLVPAVENTDKDVSVEIEREEDFYYLLDGINFDWELFYEEFAGDDYFKGPEFSTDVEAGEYNIKVFSPDNFGKYVLVVGEKEELPFNEMINTLVNLPSLKKFFDKSPWQAFLAPIVLRFLVLPILFLGAFAFVAYYLIVKKKKVKK